MKCARRRRLVRRAPVWACGWHADACAVPSPNINARPAGAAVTLAVIHSISLPPGRYGGDAIERLFTNTLDPAAHPYFEGLRGLEVSAHFLIRRDGQLLQFAPVGARAWHAGRSCWRGEPNCNDFSLGIELEGLEGCRFEPAQYLALARLLRAAQSHWPLREAVGHEHIAPGRKRDPGPGFEWQRLRRLLRGCRLRCWPDV